MKLDDMTDEQALEWIDKAQTFVDKQGWTYNDFDRHELVYRTAAYLYFVQKLTSQKPSYPLYVVHCMEDDWRFETASYSLALEKYKHTCRDGKRAGMFCWKNKQEQELLYSSECYPYSRDFV